MDQAQVEEKYKATKLWNDAIRAFRNQMPVKHHRKHFKLFSDTFTGAEAVDWLHGYLSAKAGDKNELEMTKRVIVNKVTRDQTLALLNKFYDHGLFEIARAKGQEKSANFRVKDDSTLYRFSDLTPSKIARTPLALKNSRVDVSSAKKDGSQTPTSSRIFSSRPIQAVTPIGYRKLPETTVHPEAPATEQNVEKNQIIEDMLSIDDNKEESSKTEKSAKAFSCRQSSIRSKIGKSHMDQPSAIPQVQFVARQLSVEEAENVWKAVALSSLRQLLRLDDHAFNDLIFINGRDICHNAKQFTARGVTKVFSKSDDLPSWALQAMKCLANWPWKNSALNWPCYPGFERDVFATVLDFFATQSSPLVMLELQELMLDVLNRVEYLDVQQWDANNDELIQSPSTQPRHESHPKANVDDDISLETEFGPRSPVTRMIERMAPCSRASIAAKKQDDLLTGLRSELDANVRSLEEILSSLPGLVRSPRLLHDLRELRTKNGLPNEENPICRTPPVDSGNPRQFDGKVLPAFLNLPGARFSIASTMTGSFEFSATPPPNSHAAYGAPLSNNCAISNPGEIYHALLGFFTRTGRQTACQALQLCLLFLTPKSRRWLHLLLRMMAKISINYCLRLDKHNANSNRSIVMDAFCDVIFAGNHDSGMLTVGNSSNRQQRMKLLSFLLDAMNDIFAPPTELVANVDNRIREIQRTKICYNPSQNSANLLINTATTPLAFCERISPHEYQHQASFSSRHALEKLLDSIAGDPALNGGEKKKRLKKFKESYPDLFYQRFPNKATFESVIKSSGGSSLNKCEENSTKSKTLGKLISFKL